MSITQIRTLARDLLAEVGKWPPQGLSDREAELQLAIEIQRSRHDADWIENARNAYYALANHANDPDCLPVRAVSRAVNRYNRRKEASP